jgi:Fic family protein
MAHYYLAEIHPFGDGNGRTARALEALILYQARMNTYCFWSLANFWSANRNEYIIHLANIRPSCNPWEFLIWGLKGYLIEVERIKAKVLKKAKQLMLMDYVRWLNDTKKHQKPEKKINNRIVGILDFLTHSDDAPFAKFVAYPQMKTLYHKLSNQTRYRDFEKMFKLKLIRLYEKDKDGEQYIGPNYQVLEYLEYNI